MRLNDKQEIKNKEHGTEALVKGNRFRWCTAVSKRRPTWASYKYTRYRKTSAFRPENTSIFSMLSRGRIGISGHTFPRLRFANLGLRILDPFRVVYWSKGIGVHLAGRIVETHGRASE